MRKIDLMNQTFGRLTVVGPAPNSKGGQARWTCQCSCGQQKVAAASMLKCGNTKSCGCLSRETTGARSKIIHRKHGEAIGHKPTSEWMAWSSMKDRCQNPNNKSYQRYGGRGIKVCPEWFEYKQFLADMGRKPTPKHSLDRTDNNLGYSKSNCRWALPIEQSNNIRTNHNVTLGDRTQSISVWSRELGLSRREVARLAAVGGYEDIRLDEQ